MVKYGLCCISNVLTEQRKLKFSIMRYNQYCKLGHDEALPIIAERTENNLLVTEQIIKLCASKGWTYRVSSCLFPLLTYEHAKFEYHDLPNWVKLDEIFLRIANFVCDNKVRISCHPDQFNVLASNNPDVVDRTVVELEHHGWMMDKLGGDRSHMTPINIHPATSKGDPADISKRFYEAFQRCSPRVQSRLVVENEDKGIWDVSTITKHFHDKYNFPITYDNLHHKCNSDGSSDQEAFERCYDTWDVRPLFHYCESDPNKTNKRAHAEYPTQIPESYGRSCDFEIELKAKDKALDKLYEL